MNSTMDKVKRRQLIFILLSFGFFSLSRGIWYNYQNLWMQSNQLNTTTISIVTGLASLLSVSVIFIFSDLIKRERLKGFVAILLFVKLISMFLLFLLNSQGHFILIKFLIMLDLVVDTYIGISIYPVISLVKKSDYIYSIKGIIINAFYDIGVLFSGILLGRVILGQYISYNLLLFLAFLFMIISMVLMSSLSLKVDNKDREEKCNVDFGSFFRFLKSDSVYLWYFLYVLMANVGYYTIAGLKMLLLTDIVLMEPNTASNCLLVIGLLGDFVAFLILRYFTSKNYFVNIFVKFGGRLLFCFISFLTNNVYLFMLTLFYTLLFSDAYTNVTDAPYINRVSSDVQFSFINFKGMVSYFAKGIGVWFFGLSFLIGARYVFGLGAVFIFIQFLVMFKLRRLHKKNIV